MAWVKPMHARMLRIGLCLAAVALALQGIQGNDLWRVWLAADKLLLLAALVAFVTVPVLQALRLRGLLADQGIRLAGGESVRLTLCGNFMNFAAPFGSTAGDVYKAWRIGRGRAARTEAASIVLLDRAVGLSTLLLSVGAIAWLSGPQSRLGLLRPMLSASAVVLFLGAGLYAAPGWRTLAPVRALARRMPQRERIERIDRTARRLLRAPGALLRAVGVSLVLQTAAAVSFACVAASVGMDVTAAGPLELFASFSSGELVKALPGPPQGLGTMELAYAYFFAGIGAAPQIVSAALGGRLVNLVCALPGAWLLLPPGRRAVGPEVGTVPVDGSCCAAATIRRAP